MRRLKMLAAAAALMMSASGAHAVVVDLLTGPGNVAEGAYNQIVYGDFTVTAGGYRGFAGIDYKVYVDRTSIHGLGVDTTGARGVDSNDEDDMDGRNDESLLFDFNSGLWRVLGFWFVDGDHDLDFDDTAPDDEFDLFVDGTEILTDIAIEANDNNGFVSLTSLGVTLNQLTGNQFRVGADDCGFNSNTPRCHDSFYIHKIKYERVPVPEPATLGLVGLALAGFGFRLGRGRRD